MSLVPTAPLTGEVLSSEVRCTWIAHPLRDGKEVVPIDAGKSLAEIVAEVCRDEDGQPVAHTALKVWCDGRRVEPDDWPHVIPAQDVLIRRTPGWFVAPLIPILAAAVGSALVPAAGITIAGVTISAAVAGGIITAVSAVGPVGIGIKLQGSPE